MNLRMENHENIFIRGIGASTPGSQRFQESRKAGEVSGSEGRRTVKIRELAAKWTAS